MILLKKNDYHKAIDPLRQVSINTFFAQSVVNGNVDGAIYVDDVHAPKTFYVVHPYGMSLLFGENNNENFNRAFCDYALNTGHVRDNVEWMQAFPSHWDQTLAELFSEHAIRSADNKENKNLIELNTRVNFKFNPAKFSMPQRLPENVQVVRTDKQLFAEMKGSVVPAFFWKSAEDFYANGTGYSVLYNGALASTAYSAFIHGDKLEIGIETVEEFRGKGFAFFSCAALINYCLKTNFEPVWACRLENKGSYHLALKLGFEVEKLIPYYRLCK